MGCKFAGLGMGWVFNGFRNVWLIMGSPVHGLVWAWLGLAWAGLCMGCSGLSVP